jgi:hypothetical protein
MSRNLIREREERGRVQMGGYGLKGGKREKKSRNIESTDKSAVW